MPDYKTLYLKLLRATEQAANLLIAAQLECEELYGSLPLSESTEVLRPVENKKGAEDEQP